MERLDSKINFDFWKKKKVFITGHTGFKGSWLSLWLEYMGANVQGFALKPSTSPSLFIEAKVKSVIKKNTFGDIRDYKALLNNVKKFSPDIIFHMAAQPLVRQSYTKVLETYEINVMGTANILEAARQCNSVKAVINITTDKCYDNKEWIWGYREDDRLGGRDPYSNSKACSEFVTQSFKESFFDIKKIGIATVRSGNVIGGGDWAEDRLIPDIFRAFNGKKVLKVRNPKSIRPWQHVLEPLSGYLMLSERLYNEHNTFSGAWNFGPNSDDEKTVKEIVKYISSNWKGSKWKVANNSSKLHEAELLKLDISKASTLLGWRPKWTLKTTLDKIIHWQKSWINNKDIKEICIREIKSYMKS
jgi:CDP-glucose 4,6-dehydratase